MTIVFRGRIDVTFLTLDYCRYQEGERVLLEGALCMPFWQVRS